MRGCREGLCYRTVAQTGQVCAVSGDEVSIRLLESRGDCIPDREFVQRHKHLKPNLWSQRVCSSRWMPSLKGSLQMSQSWACQRAS
jgi:hypothetical protein